MRFWKIKERIDINEKYKWMRRIFWDNLIFLLYLWNFINKYKKIYVSNVYLNAMINIVLK